MLQKIRKDFPILGSKVNGKPLVYFDNAATSQKPWRLSKQLNIIIHISTAMYIAVCII